MLISYSDTVHAFSIEGRESRAKGREPTHQTSSCRLCVTHDLKRIEINERKSIEYCALSNRLEAGITEQSPSRTAQNDWVLRAACGTPSHDAKRKSQRRN